MLLHSSHFTIMMVSSSSVRASMTANSSQEMKGRRDFEGIEVLARKATGVSDGAVGEGCGEVAAFNGIRGGCLGSLGLGANERPEVCENSGESIYLGGDLGSAKESVEFCLA